MVDAEKRIYNGRNTFRKNMGWSHLVNDIFWCVTDDVTMPVLNDYDKKGLSLLESTISFSVQSGA